MTTDALVVPAAGFVVPAAGFVVPAYEMPKQGRGINNNILQSMRARMGITDNNIGADPEICINMCKHGDILS